MRGDEEQKVEEASSGDEGWGVDGSGGSGLCPTRKPTRKRSGSRFLTRNRPVKRVGFRGSVFRQVASVSDEAETRRKT